MNTPRDFNGRFTAKKEKILTEDVARVVIEDLEKRLHIAESSLKHSEESVTVLKERIERFKNDISQLNTSLIESRKEISLYAEERGKLSKEFQALQKVSADLIAKNSGYKSLISMHEKKVQWFNSVTEQYNAQVTGLQSEVKAAREKILSDKDIIGKLHATILEQEGLINVYSDRHNKVKKDIIVRALLWGTVGMMAGVLFEMIVKIFR